MRCVSCDAELTPAARFCAACAAPAPAAPGDSTDALRTALEKALGFQYRVERLLGRGGMGAVYLARELALDREVAIKVLPPERNADDGRARFRREARTAARLSHPNVVSLLTFGEVSGLTYSVLSYVRGESLATRIRREGRLPPEVVARILSEIADALDYAHRQGVVHRDVKPDNVLLDEDSGRAMLTDFGIARAQGVHALTSTGMIVGTPRYMSPEQAAGAPEIDGRSDLYSLGLIGYEMLAGAAPFDGGTPSDMLLQRLSRDPAPLSQRAPETPAWLAAAITRCLARDPAARWPDAQAFRRQLLSGETESDMPAALSTLNTAAQVVALSWAYGAGEWLWAKAVEDRNPFLFFDPHDGNFNPQELLSALCLMPPLLFLMSLHARRKGYSWTAIGRALVRQPRWWMGWYPRPGRAPGDVWSQLPGHVRTARVFLSMGLFIPPILILLGAIDRSAMEHYQRTGSWRGLTLWLGREGGMVLGPSLGAALVLASLATLAAIVGSIRRLRQGPLPRGGETDEVWPVLTRSTANARFWAKLPYRTVLHPPNRVVAPSRTVDPGRSESEGQTRTRA